MIFVINIHIRIKCIDKVDYVRNKYSVLKQIISAFV